MSYILNALRKSEQERHEGVEDSLENRIQNPQTNNSKKTSKGFIALIAINILFLIYFIWSMSRQEHTETIIEKVIIKPETIKQQSIEKVSKLPVVNKVVSPILTPHIVRQPLIQVLSISEQIQKQKISTMAAKIKTQSKSSIIKPKPVVVAEAVKVIKQPKPIIKEPIIERESTIIVQKKKNTIPFLSELEYDFRRNVPDIDINVYVYAEMEHDRFIMIAMRKYQAGEEIAPGLTLKEIRMNSFVVKYRNKKFQIKRK